MFGLEKALTLNKSMSMGQAVLLFYMLIGTNFTKDLYSGKLRDFIKENRYAQHFVGLFIMFFIITHYTKVDNMQQSIMFSIFSYMWFIFSSKLDIMWSLSTILLLVIAFLYETNMEFKEKRIEKDQALYPTDKKRIRKHHDTVKKIVTVALIAVTLIGTYQYFNKKVVQYGGNFDTTKFLFNDRNY